MPQPPRTRAKLRDDYVLVAWLRRPARHWPLSGGRAVVLYRKGEGWAQLWHYEARAKHELYLENVSIDTAAFSLREVGFGTQHQDSNTRRFRLVDGEIRLVSQ